MKSVRRTIPHLHTMTWNDLAMLIGKGYIDFSRITEKTDGWAFRAGIDDKGFWTQNTASGKDKMREGTDYFKRAQYVLQNTGRKPSVQVAQCFEHIHNALAKNTNLLNILKYVNHISGEVFYRPVAFPSLTEPNHLCMIGTSYHPLSMRDLGIVWLHSELEHNQKVNLNDWKKCSDNSFNFTHDRLTLPVQRLELTEGMPRYYNMLEFHKTRDAISKYVDSFVLPLLTASKWGDGAPEGIVIHPSPLCKDQPRFKITSEAFRRYREQVKRDGWEHSNRRLASAAG